MAPFVDDLCGFDVERRCVGRATRIRIGATPVTAPPAIRQFANPPKLHQPTKLRWWRKLHRGIPPPAEIDQELLLSLFVRRWEFGIIRRCEAHLEEFAKSGKRIESDAGGLIYETP